VEKLQAERRSYLTATFLPYSYPFFSSSNDDPVGDGHGVLKIRSVLSHWTGFSYTLLFNGEVIDEKSHGGMRKKGRRRKKKNQNIPIEIAEKITTEERRDKFRVLHNDGDED
jgi:hypothetical protein